ncbi:LuxR C-terminal-related transcriptional regulator [Micromonospora sp. NPDC050397]|uniref:LuxR C-terminal-related transcriptional regulator n=1 Tax=Micromonospora sp. NPDC050397 TaxID=3364279 RepID=UPI00384B42A5
MLPAVQRSILRSLALTGTPGELWFVERMVRRSGPVLDHDIDALIARDLLRDTADGLRLPDGALRRAVIRGTPPSLRTAIRVRAAAILADSSPTRATRLVLRALNLGWPVHVGRAESAPPGARPGAGTGRIDFDLVTRLTTDASVDPSVAADLLLAIRSHFGAAIDPGHRRLWLPTLVDHLMLAGRTEQALAVLTEEIAVDRDGPAERAVLLGRLGAWHSDGRPALALGYLRRALAQEGVGPTHRSWLLTTLAVTAGPLGAPDPAAVTGPPGHSGGAAGSGGADARRVPTDPADLLAEAERAERRMPAPGGTVRLALARAGYALARGDLPSARRALDRVDPDLPASRAPAALLRVYRIATRIALGEFDDARSGITAASVEVGQLGAVVEPMLDALDCLLRVSLGELPEAETRTRLALLARPHRQPPEEVRLELLSVRVEVLFRRGELDRARALLDAERPASGWPDLMSWVRLGCAAAGDPEPARHASLLQGTVAGLGHSLAQLVRLPARGPRLVRALLWLGEPALARTVAGQLATVADLVDNPLWRGVAAHAAGLVERDPVRLREGVSRLRSTSARPALADALLDLARLPALAPAESAAAAQESAALYGRIGADGDQSLAQRHLRVLGQTPQRPRSARPRTGLDSLTGGELRVASLLAAGATKQQAAARLFISFHTVDSHLRAVYAKLGIRSRLELARIWRGNPPEPPTDGT